MTQAASRPEAHFPQANEARTSRSDATDGVATSRGALAGSAPIRADLGRGQQSCIALVTVIRWFWHLQSALMTSELVDARQGGLNRLCRDAVAMNHQAAALLYQLEPSGIVCFEVVEITGADRHRVVLEIFNMVDRRHRHTASEGVPLPWLSVRSPDDQGFDCAHIGLSMGRMQPGSDGARSRRRCR